MKKVFIIIIFLTSALFSLYAQTDFSVNAGIEVPVTNGTMSVSSGVYVNTGVSVAMPFLRDLRFLADISYASHLFEDSIKVNFLSGQIGAGYRFPVTKAFSISPRASAGYYYGWSPALSSNSSNLTITPGIDFTYMFSRVFGLTLKSAYRMYMGKSDIFYSSVQVSLGIAISPWNIKRSAKIRITEPERDILFPIFRYYYDSNPLGTVTFSNEEKEPITDVSVKFFIPEYMREPRLCATIETVSPGESVSADLLALFNNEIFNIQEGEKVDGTVIIEYSFHNSRGSESRTDTYKITFRNGMRWENDSAAACFITAKDPVILKIGKSISGISSTIQAGNIPGNIVKAAGVYSFIRDSGIQYVVDPNSPYTELSEDSSSIDFLQFPVETLQYFGGDCDDLSILYSALLEGMGIQTAFITIPAHIYIAFNSGLKTTQFQNQFHESPGFIDHNGDAWIPLEVTLINKNFEKAWKLGFSEWNDNTIERQLTVIQTAWETYPPVQPIFEQNYDYSIDRGILRDTITDEISNLINSLSKAIIQPLLESLQEDPEDIRTKLQLGVAYARFGKFEEAEELFKEVYSQGSSAAPLINLGNIYFMKRDYQTSAEYFQKAWDAGKRSPYVARALSQAYRESGNYTEADVFESLLEGGSDTTSSASGRSSEAITIEGEISWEESL